MPRIHQIFMKSQRLLIILLAIVAFILLLLIDGNYIFYATVRNEVEGVVLGASFGFSLILSMSFLVVGVFVWLYARNRQVASPVLGLCLSLGVAFTLQGRDPTNGWLDFLTGTSSSLSVIFLSAFLMIFPHNLLQLTEPHVSKLVSWLSRLYLWIISLSGAWMISLFFVSYVLMIKVSSWLYLSNCVYFSLAFVGIFFLLIYSYRISSLYRERQQILLFVGGVIIVAIPLLIFTVFPIALGMAPFNGRLTAATLCFFPLALGYSILRYQILIFDSYICKAVSIIFGVVVFATLTYVIVALGNIFLINPVLPHRNLYELLIVCLVTFLAPAVWWLAKMLSEKIFFREISRYRRLLVDSTMLTDETLEVRDAASLITAVAIRIFETAQVCVFVFDESREQYCLSPALVDNASDEARRSLLCALLQTLHVPERIHETRVDYLDTFLPAVQRLEAARRPLLISEVVRSVDDEPVGLERYLTSPSSLGEKEWLLAPIRAQGRMIGILVLGERGDQTYAGPELEVAQLLVTQFSTLLETARLYARTTRHTSLLNTLYSISSLPNSAFNTLQEAINTYTIVAAEATAAAAEMWLYDHRLQQLQLVAATGRGSSLVEQSLLSNVQSKDWMTYFFQGKRTFLEDDQAAVIPPCLPGRPISPFAWLPLQKNERFLGVLVVTYSHPHYFLREEMRALEMFASQCLVALENVQMTTELRATYERQKELDQLKDQFIMTASHELRTPLTTVLGYIELLDQYHEKLEAESRAEFIEKAQRGCDELSLLVSNIMDAGRVNLDTEVVHLRPIALLDALSHVLEIVEATLTGEQRSINVEIAKDLYVAADDVRLRQVLLNLISNALKYSPAGTPLLFSATSEQQQVIMSIRDYGPGVPPTDQQRLFERFVRLERDINSPVRGAGLGLFICRRLLDVMGGRIWLESSGLPGDGCIFSFALQLAPKKHAAETETVQLPV
ncbi:sensor histidine kinase [Dictyobacter kobayashii]|uniref:histidine kinase n=1 Tax=Dictyobacter kobayashii TaxID=2014872 RepID=A0A402ACY6_9CHLR|nr:ATP-binding protein [Dictyobacter kobayashii]GCE16946.1 hypothetical protein KDK_07460 [Dictyobacter kobayashii]